MEIVKERKTRGLGRPQNVHASLKIPKRRPRVLINPGARSWIIGELLTISARTYRLLFPTSYQSVLRRILKHSEQRGRAEVATP